MPTPSPASSSGLMREPAPSSVLEARQMIGLPPGERAAPRRKAGWVETPP
jgi:hypothetical protein